MRAWTRLCTEPGTPAAELCSAWRSSCSRNRGLPAARSMQRSREVGAGVEIRARRARSPPRAQGTEIDGHQGAAARSATRQAWSKGSPSMREVMTSSARALGDRPGERRQAVERRAGPPSARPRPPGAAAAACGRPHQIRGGRPLAAVARGVVHGVVEGAQAGRLRQVQQIVQVGPLIVGHADRRAERASLRRLRPRPASLPVVSPSRLRTSARIASCAGAGAEIEHQGDMAGEARRRGQRLELLDDAGLADARPRRGPPRPDRCRSRGRRRARRGTGRARRAGRRRAGARARPRRHRSGARPGPARPGP